MAFNSDEYAWKDLKLVVGGRPITGARGIKWKVTRTTTDIYGSGDEPYSRTKGNKSYTGELKLLQSEVEALISSVIAAGGEDLTDVTLDVVVVFALPNSPIIKTHIAKDCDITDYEMGMEQNDPNMEVTLPIMIRKIQHVA